MSAPIIAVVGWHNVGKTTLIEKLVAEAKRRGLRVATIKHTRGDFELDRPGTDTWRYAKAGSDIVVIAGRGRLAWLEQQPDDHSLDELLARLPEDIDLVIAEGYKRSNTPKIEVIAPGLGMHHVPVGGRIVAQVISRAPRLGTEADSGDTGPLDTPALGVPRFEMTDTAGLVMTLIEEGLFPSDG